MLNKYANWKNTHIMDNQHMNMEFTQLHAAYCSSLLECSQALQYPLEQPSTEVTIGNSLS